jgi:hypothetical protein
MHDDHLVDLPDDQYRAHWLAFHETVDWAAHRDMTSVPITFDGPDALYRRNKGSFMERLEPDVHCRPYAGHARRARRTGAWIPEEKVFEAALVPTLDLTAPRRAPDLRHMLRKIFAAPPPAPIGKPTTITTIKEESYVLEGRSQGASPSSSRLASTP